MTRLRVCLVARPEPGITGTSRYVASLAPHLKELGCAVRTLTTKPAGWGARALKPTRAAGIDAPAFLASYPVHLRWPAADIYHLTGQTCASVLLFSPPPGPVVVTVHDIIPYLVRHDRRLNVYRHPIHRLFDWLAMRGLRRATALIADSEWTRQTLVDHLRVPHEQTTAVPLGVNTETYRPISIPEDFRQSATLPEGPAYVLYVGSEDPRKNLEALWRAFARVHALYPDAVLLKAGRGHHSAKRGHLTALADRLGIGTSVRFLDDVPEVDLPLLYNSARVYVQPSLYEGFGLPVLEALACGTRVACANTSALPEIAGADSVLCAPDADSLAAALSTCARREAGGAARDARRAWAAGFSWERTARRTAEVLARARSA